jgi:hypothetical protein
MILYALICMNWESQMMRSEDMVGQILGRYRIVRPVGY